MKNSQKYNSGRSIDPYMVFWGATKYLGGISGNKMKRFTNTIFRGFGLLVLASTKICPPHPTN